MVLGKKNNDGKFWGEQKLVFIGIDMDKEYLINVLNSALID